VSVAEKTFVVGGRYWTTELMEAVVDAVTEDGQLVGRVNVAPEGCHPQWTGEVWDADGTRKWSDYRRLMYSERPQKIKATYWLNIYSSGPGQLRKTWEESLIEASRSYEDAVLCRVEVKVDAKVGEGLR